MNSTDSHIILLNFDFPPNYGIGGRRWAKFAKELASRRIHVHVIKAEPKDGRNSHWSKDVESEFIHVIEIKRKAELDRFKTGFFWLDKLGYRLALAANKWWDPGTPYDMAIGNKEAIQSQISKLVNTHDVKWIVATGAPFNLLYFAADFIRLNPRYKLWADLRDPWLDAKNYGMPQLSSKRKAAEWRKAEIVLKYASVVSCPTLDAIRVFDNIDNGKYSKNLLELRHFFDPRDFDVRISNVSSNKIKVVYGGDIYPGAERFVHQMLEDLRQLKKDSLEVYNRMDVRFYSDGFSKIQKDYSDLEVVHIGPSIGENIFDEMANSDWCIILLTDFNRHFFTTKYFEYQPFEKPYLYLGPEGRVSNEIRDQKAGLNWEEFLIKLRTAEWSSIKRFERGSSLHTGSLQVRTDELLAKMAEFD